MNPDIIIEKAKELFVKNWKVKLGSVFLATIFYINLQNSKVLIKNINIPVDYPKLEAGMYYSTDPDKTFPIRVEGLREVVNYYSQFMKAIPDYSNLEPGENDIVIKNITGVPNGVKITKLKKSIKVNLEGIGTKVVNVDVNFEGDLPSNYEKVSYRVRPNKVTISGKQSDVEKVNRILLPSISLEEVNESFVKKLRIPDLPKGVFVTGGIKQATVSVTISSQDSKSGEQTITGIPVKCTGTNKYLEPDLSEEQVSVKINTKVPVKSSSIINGIQATVPCNYTYDFERKKIIPNAQPISEKVRISRSRDLKNIDILQVIPDRVTITYRLKDLGRDPIKDKREDPPQPMEEEPLPPPPENLDIEEISP
ncbi:MAG: YbbR-like domain-containing protein [Leptospira sp.]|nr:YbbR-like domain-containing protein [Leptospira sp.]